MYRNDGGMRLSMGVLGAFAKYTVTARVRASATQSYRGLKKFGVFESDAELFAKVADAVGLPAETIGADRWWRRHPLVFLVEAADDICYNILGMLAARFLAYGLGMAAMARSENPDPFWIRNIVLIQAIDFGAGLYYIATGVIGVAVAAFPMLNAAIFGVLLWLSLSSGSAMAFLLLLAQST